MCTIAETPSVRLVGLHRIADAPGTFEEWFAVRPEHRDDDFWPALLVFDPKEGISLKSINFADPRLWYANPTFEADTITGYLDYQRPATIIAPFIQAASPGRIGAETPYVRAKYNVVGNGVLKNFHLENLDDECFTGFRVRLPSFQAWIAPRLVKADYETRAGFPALTVQVRDPTRREYELSAEARAEVLTQASAASTGDDTPIIQQTWLAILLAIPVTYEAVMRLAATTDVVFAFMIGSRPEAAVHYLPTTKALRGTDRQQTAEFWVVPAWKRAATVPHWRQRVSWRPTHL